MLVRKPVVLPVLVFKEGVPQPALFLPEVRQRLATLLRAAEAQLIVPAEAGAAAIRRAAEVRGG